MINLLAKINISNENDYLEAISSSNNIGQKKIFFYLNSHVLYEANHDSQLKEILLSCDYLIADGYSIVWAIRILLKRNVEKVVFTYSYFKFLRELFIKQHTPLFFLGASETIINTAVEIENTNYPKLNITGYHNGYFDKKHESDKVINIINKSGAEVLIVGMGCPITEKWILQNKEKLNLKLIFSVGGFFDFLSEIKRQAPKFLYNSGFEWVFRLIQEPRRLFRRYLFANSYLILFTLKNMLLNKRG